jgi:hypothetical protein
MGGFLSIQKYPKKFKRTIQWLTKRYNVLIMFCIYQVLIVPGALRELRFGTAFALIVLNLAFTIIFSKRLGFWPLPIIVFGNFILICVITIHGGQKEFLATLVLGTFSGSILLTLYDWFT